MTLSLQDTEHDPTLTQVIVDHFTKESFKGAYSQINQSKWDLNPTVILAIASL
jgi:hypothetical protein